MNHSHRQILTLVADRTATSLEPGLIAAVTDAVGGGPAAILSPGEAADLPVAADVTLEAVRAAIGTARIDAFLSESEGRRKRLLIADMDSTIVTSETLDELADFAGLKAQISAITARAMAGELDFKSALRERVGMLAGLSTTALDGTWERVELTPGARELVATMRKHGAFTALVSGGFTFFTSRVKDLVGFDWHQSNTLLEADGKLSGKVGEPILDRDAKLAALREHAARINAPLSAAIAIGDGANDLDMIREAGMGIAFHAKPIVAAEARYRIDYGNLRAVLFAQGYAAADIVGE